MPHPLAAVPLTIPFVITIAGAAAEIVFSWYDPDFYQQLWWDADLDERAARLNNDWHNLWRSARSAGYSRSDVELQNLDAVMGRWWAWKTELDKATLRRAYMPFGRDWAAELDLWVQAFHQQVLIFARADERVRQELAARGVDPDRDYPVREPTPRWVWGGLALGGAFVIGLGLVAWIATSGARRDAPR